VRSGLILTHCRNDLRHGHRVVSELTASTFRCEIVRQSDRIPVRHAMYLKYANAIFDLVRSTALPTVHGYLRDLGIAYCGRYGDWEYLWRGQLFISGENAMQRILDRGGR
jgi:hypothetical protein